MPSDLRFGIAPAFVTVGFLLFLLAELRFPLRRMREPKLRRLARNLSLAGLGLAVFELLQIPVLLPVSRWTMEKRIGLLNWLPASGWMRTAVAVVLLDYTLWFWHWMNHRIPFFWRFHRVHHVDRDMDASTGLRFHFGELAMAFGFRALQVAAVGADALSISVYQVLLFASVLFHHSNTRLPLRLERVLARLIVTPRMHGIHHSSFRNEADSNWSSILSTWDYLHGTVRLDVPQAAISIGVPAFDAPEKVTFGRLLLLPLRRAVGDWKRSDGSSSTRPADRRTRAQLLS